MQFSKYLAKKYGTPSPGAGSAYSANSSVSFGSGGSRATPGSVASDGSNYGSTPVPRKNAYQVDTADYSPNTAVEMQRAQIEKMSRHIADLKAAELDLAATEMENERRKMSEIMKSHNEQIEVLKGTISQTTEEVEAAWQAKVDTMRAEMTDMEYARDQLENEKDQLESEKDELASEKDELESEKEDLESELTTAKAANGELQSLVQESREAEQHLQQQLKLASADHQLKMTEKSKELAAMEKTLKEYEQNQSEQLQAARSQADGYQTDLEQATLQIEEMTAQLAQSQQDAQQAAQQATLQIEELTTQLAQSQQDAQNATVDLQRQLADASGNTAAQNASLVNLETNLQSEIDSLKESLSSKTQTIEAFETKISASGMQSLEDMISRNATLEASNAQAKAQIGMFAEHISNLQDQIGSDEAEWGQMAMELKEQKENLQAQNMELEAELEEMKGLKMEKELIESRLQIVDSRCADLEANIVKEKEENSKLWGKSQDTRRKDVQLQKELQDTKETVAEAQLKQIELQETIRSLQDKDRQTTDELATMNHANKEATSNLEKEIVQLQSTNASLQDDSKRALDVVQQCYSKLKELTPFAQMIITDSIGSACEQLLSATDEAMAAHETAVVQASKDAQDAQEATAQLSIVSKLDASSSAEEYKKKLKIARANQKVIEQDRSNLAEQNAFLHMDVARLTTSLTDMISKGQRRDEEVMRLQSNVEELSMQLESALAQQLEAQPETQVQVIHSHAPAKTVIKEVVKEVVVVKEVEVPAEQEPELVLADMQPAKMRMKKNAGAFKYDQMVTELRGTIQETSQALASANADKQFISDQFQGCLEQVEKLAASLEAETEAKQHLEAEVENLRTECQLLAKDSEQTENELARVQHASNQVAVHMQHELNASVAATKLHDLDAAVAQEQLEQMQQELEQTVSNHMNTQRELRSEVDQVNGTMTMQMWEKGVELDKLREQTANELAQAAADAATAQENLRSELRTQQIASNESIINLQRELTATHDGAKMHESNVYDLQHAVEEQTMMHTEAQQHMDEVKAELAMSVAQNNELIQTLATLDADAEADMGILHDRIMNSEARYKELENQWTELTGELKQFAADVESMAGSGPAGPQATPKAAAALLGFTNASGGWQAQLRVLRDRIADIAGASGDASVDSNSWTSDASQVDSEVSEITSPAQTSAAPTDAQMQAMGQFIQRLAALYKQEKQESADMATMLKSMAAKTKSTPGRTPRRGLSNRNMNTPGSGSATPTKGADWTKTLASLQSKHSSLSGVQEQVMDQLAAMENFIQGEVESFQPMVMNLRVETSVVDSMNLSLNTDATSTPALAKVGQELEWWTSLSNTGRKHMLAAAPSGKELGLFIDGEARWDKDMKLRVLSPEKEIVPAEGPIGTRLEIDSLKKQLVNAEKQLQELREANDALQAAAKEAPPTPKAEMSAPMGLPMSASASPAMGLPVSASASPAAAAAAALQSPVASPVYVDAVPMPSSTPDWGNLTPLRDGLFGDEQIAALSYSVNKELSALHQRAVEINLVQQAEGTPDGAPRRALSEIQETILGHISELSNCVAEAIREWNGAAMSPAGKDAKHKLGSLQQQAVGLSAAFQRTMGSSGAGWEPPVQHFAADPPTAVPCPMPMMVPNANGESAQRSLQFSEDGTTAASSGSSAQQSSAAGSSYATQQQSMGYLLRSPSPFGYSGYAPESDLSGNGLATDLDQLPPTVTYSAGEGLSGMSGDGLAASLTSLPSTVAHFETASQAAQATLSAAMVEQRSMQTSPMQDDAGRCKALRRALVKAHEDYVKTAAQEKEVIEKLTAEIERLQGGLHMCISRERSKDEKWGSWVRAVFKLCCDPANPDAAPMEATSAMMMAVEQFIVGHHEQVKEYEGQLVQYERNLDNMVEQKMHLTRVLGIYGEIQEDATRTIQMLGNGPSTRAASAPTSLRELAPLTRFRVAVMVVLACTTVMPVPAAVAALSQAAEDTDADSEVDETR